MNIHELLRDPIDMDAVGGFLDSLHNEGRIAAARSLSGPEQARLFEAAKGFRKITIADFVDPSLEALTPVVHYGKNSLPAFKLFKKCFTKPAGATNALWGYNEQTLKAATGPGYFICYDVPDGEVLIDYTKVPVASAGVPAGWPAIIGNDKRLSRWIYDGTQDLMRGVSNHITIGRASRGGDPMPNWFVLCREDRR